MKFADKLFFTMLFLLTIVFTIFGVWMMQADFSRMLNREMEHGNHESRMFHFLFETGYRETEDFGEDLAVNMTMESVAKNVERNGSRCFVMKQDGAFYYGEDFVKSLDFEEEVRELASTLGDQVYAACVRRADDGYYMLGISVAETRDSCVYLGMCRELTPIYQDRQGLLDQYGIALICLLAAGGVGIYLLSRYITWPISNLNKLAGRIAEGEFDLRSHNKSGDEVGSLAGNFNRMADRLVAQMEEKSREARQKEDFTTAFAHELKTPLTSIIGYADMLNSVELSEQEKREAYYYIYSQGKRLESLSHKLLELAGMNRGTESFRPVSTKSLEGNIRTTMRPIWRKRGIRGKVDLDRGTILGDEELLLSLFYNLLDNAVKAMDKEKEGFILLKGTVLPEGYEIKAVDNGRGIPREEIGHITEAFYMVDKSRSRREGGAGIGMALCEKIARLHGADLEIDSNVGEGTVIKVRFPSPETFQA